MKKVVSALAVLTVTAVVSSAASFIWGTGNLGTSSVKWEGANISDGSVTGHLVYLGSTGDSFYQIEDFKVINPEMQTATSIASVLPIGGRVNNTFASTMGDIMPGTSDTLANGAVFGMFVTWTDSTGQEWINVASNTYTVSGLADDSSIIEDAIFTFNYDKSSDNTLTAGGGWVAVPEPATAALALAGVAMLFRRRK